MKASHPALAASALIVLLAGLLGVACSESAGSTSDAGGGAAGIAGSVGIGGAKAFTVNVVVGRLATPPCLPRALAVDPDGQTSCLIAEVKISGGCDCNASGRIQLDQYVTDAVLSQLRQSTTCTDMTACANACTCGVGQEVGAASAACKSNPVTAANDPAVPPGFCYIDDPTSPSLVMCPANQPQMIGFVSPSAAPTPLANAALFVTCEYGAP